MANLDRRSYRKIYRRLWSNAEFRNLSDRDKVVALYILSGPQTNRIGLFRMSFGELAEDLRMPTQTARARVCHVCNTIGWRFDADSAVVWIPTWWSFNPPGERETNFKGMLTDLNDVPRTPLMLLFCRNLVDIPTAQHKHIEAWAERAQRDASVLAQPLHSVSTAPTQPLRRSSITVHGDGDGDGDVHGDGDGELKAGAAPPPPPNGLRTRPEPTPAQLAKMAHCAIDETPDGTFVDWKEDIKGTLARTGFAYDSEAAGKALESAQRQRDLAKARKAAGL